MAAPLLQNCQKQRSFGEAGDFQEDILDPRIQTELEKLNNAADDINRLELALDEARANFRQNLTESTQQLNVLAKKLGNCIEKARPYYEARLQLKEAQIETQNAALRFDRACSQLMAAKEMVFLAEQGYFKKGQPFDPAWQEMLNHATTRVNEAETERLESELEHQQTASLFNEAEQLVKVLQKDLKRAIAKSRPYFELKAKFHQHMEDCKKYVTQLEQGVSYAKKSYADALFRLEKISDEIHQLRAEAKLRQEMGDRGMGVGAETPSPPPEESDKNYDTLAAKGSGVNNVSCTGVKNASQSGVENVSQTGLENVSEAELERVLQSGMKDTHKPGMKDTHEPGMKDTHEPGMKDTHEPGMKDTHEPGMKDTHEPGMKDTHEPGMKDTHEPGMKDTHEPGMKDTHEPGMKNIAQREAAVSDVDRRQSLDMTISDGDQTICAEPMKQTTTEEIQNSDSTGSDRHHLDNSPEPVRRITLSVEEGVHAEGTGENCVVSLDRTNNNVTRDEPENTAVESDIISDRTSGNSKKETPALMCINESDKNESKNETACQNEDIAGGSEDASFTDPLIGEKCTPLSEDRRVTSQPRHRKSPLIYTNKGIDSKVAAGIEKSTVLDRVRNFEKAISTGKATLATEVTPVSLEKIADDVKTATETVPEKNSRVVAEKGEASPQENVSVALTLTSPDSEKSLAFSAILSSPDSENNSERERTMSTNAEVMERVQQTKDVARRRFLRLRRASHDNLLDEFSDTDSESVASVSMLDDEQVESLMQETSEYVNFLTKLDATNPPLIRRKSLPGKLNYLANYVNSRPMSLAVVGTSKDTEAQPDQTNSNVEIQSMRNRSRENCAIAAEDNNITGDKSENSHS